MDLILLISYQAVIIRMNRVIINAAVYMALTICANAETGLDRMFGYPLVEAKVLKVDSSESIWVQPFKAEIVRVFFGKENWLGHPIEGEFVFEGGKNNQLRILPPVPEEGKGIIFFVRAAADSIEIAELNLFSPFASIPATEGSNRYDYNEIVRWAEAYGELSGLEKEKRWKRIRELADWSGGLVERWAMRLRARQEGWYEDWAEENIPALMREARSKAGLEESEKTTVEDESEGTGDALAPSDNTDDHFEDSKEGKTARPALGWPVYAPVGVGLILVVFVVARLWVKKG